MTPGFLCAPHGSAQREGETQGVARLGVCGCLAVFVVHIRALYAWLKGRRGQGPALLLTRGFVGKRNYCYSWQKEQKLWEVPALWPWCFPLPAFRCCRVRETPARGEAGLY